MRYRYAPIYLRERRMGDRLHAVLCAAGYNIKWALFWLSIDDLLTEGGTEYIEGG